MALGRENFSSATKAKSGSTHRSATPAPSAKPAPAPPPIANKVLGRRQAWAARRCPDGHTRSRYRVLTRWGQERGAESLLWPTGAPTAAVFDPAYFDTKTNTRMRIQPDGSRAGSGGRARRWR